MIQTTTVRTRQVIEAESKNYEGMEGVLRSLRQEWQDAPLGACNLLGHEDRVAVEAVKIIGGWLHNCADCKPRWEAEQKKAERSTRERSSRAAQAGMRAQTQHRQ